MKRILPFVLASVLIGCSSQVDDWEIESVRSQCEARGGLSVIDVVIVVGGRCRDGAWVKPTRGK